MKVKKRILGREDVFATRWEVPAGSEPMQIFNVYINQ